MIGTLQLLVQLSTDKSKIKSNLIEYYRVGRPSSIEKQDIKLFLRIFSQVRKNLKRGNQYDVANAMKKLFREGYRELVIYNYANYNVDQGLSEREFDVDKCNLVKLIKVNRQQYFNKYGTCESIDAYELALNRLQHYISDASPAAIVQIRKRFSLKH